MPDAPAFPEVDAAPGVRRRVLAESRQLMVVAVAFAAGAVGARHRHPHAQASYVESGRFRFEIDGREVELGPGDAVTVPPDTDHGCLCLAAGRLIDCFAPRRDDFL